MKEYDLYIKKNKLWTNVGTFYSVKDARDTAIKRKSEYIIVMREHFGAKWHLSSCV